jgi:CHAT domain-containing protein
MQRSYAEMHDTTCSHCGKIFEASVWRLIVALEHHELIVRGCNKLLNVVPCPQCGNSVYFKSPLLVIGQHSRVRLLFVNCDGYKARDLLELARQRYGADWHEAWCENSIFYDSIGNFANALERELFAIGHADITKAMTYTYYSQLQADPLAFPVEMHKLLRISYIQILYQDWKELLLPNEQYQFVLEHPDIYSTESLELLSGYIYDFRLSGDQEQSNYMMQHLSLFQDCARIGPDAAYAAHIPNNLHLLSSSRSAIGQSEPVVETPSLILQALFEQAEQLYISAIERLQPVLYLRFVDFVARKLPDPFTQVQPRIMLADLASMLTTSHIRLYMMRLRDEDLDLAIHYAERACELAGSDKQRSTLFLSNYAGALLIRFENRHDFAALDTAIWQLQRAFYQADREETITFQLICAQLGKALLERYHMTARFDDLERAYYIHELALALDQRIIPSNRGVFNLFCLSHLAFFEVTGREQILEQVLELFATLNEDEQAIRAGDEPIFYARGMHSLRKHLLKSEQDASLPLEERVQVAQMRQKTLDYALYMRQEALSSFQPEYPHLATFLAEQADDYQERYRLLGEQHDFEQAMEHYRRACSLDTRYDLLGRYRAAAAWARWLLELKRWGEASSVASLALQWFSHHLDTLGSSNLREPWLAELGDLAQVAAYATARSGDARQAAQIIENNRARVARTFVQFSDESLHRLQQNAPELAERYQCYLFKLAWLDRMERQLEFSSDSGFSAFNMEITETIQGYHVLIDQISSILGPEVDVPIAIPYAYLLSTAVGSLTLYYTPGATSPECLWADKILNTMLPLEFSAQHESSLLPLVGEALMAPIAERVRHSGAEQILLIPVAELAHLPLAAAPYVTAAGSSILLDECLPLFSPSIALYGQAQVRAKQRSLLAPRLLTIGNPAPDDEALDDVREQLQHSFAGFHQFQQMSMSLEANNLVSLPDFEQLLQTVRALIQLPNDRLLRQGSEFLRLRHSTYIMPGLSRSFYNEASVMVPVQLPYASLEAQAVAELFPSHQVICLTGTGVTQTHLSEGLASANLLHFACHGLFDPVQPLESSLRLALAGSIRLRDLLNGTISLPQASLVVLSACQTGQSAGRRLLNDALSLAGGFLVAGAPAVIATLWSIADHSAALLIYRFYELLSANNEDSTAFVPDQALREAQRWLRDSTFESLDTYCQNKIQALRQQTTTGQKSLNFFRTLRSQLDEERLKWTSQAIGDERPFASVMYWGAFCYNGASLSEMQVIA